MVTRCDSLVWATAQAGKAGEGDRRAGESSLPGINAGSLGDDQFAVLVRRYKDRVVRLAASILGPAHTCEAEDLAQEVFILVYRKYDSFRHDSNFATWLYRVTRNRALDRRRLARYRRPHVGEEGLDALPAPGVDPERRTVVKERRAAVLRHLEHLPETQRMVVHLHYWTGFGIKEIASLLEMKVDTVKSHLFRARKRLAGELAGEVSADV